MYEKLCDPPSAVVPGVKVCCDSLINLQKEKLQPKDNETDERFAMDIDNNCTPGNIDLNSTLVSLDDTPIKRSILPVSSKITKGKQKLAPATQTLKRKLEHTYEVPLST